MQHIDWAAVAIAGCSACSRIYELHQCVKSGAEWIGGDCVRRQP